MKKWCFRGLLVLSVISAVQTGWSDVVSKEAGGFQLSFRKNTTADRRVAYQVLVSRFSQWWDSAHTYSGDSGNLSIDLQKSCILEALPGGGFVRHMEVVYHDPKQTTLRLTGGLGPLQEMGVQGAMTFQVITVDGQTEIRLTYNVVGHSALNLDRLAPVVDRVLSEQLARLSDLCNRSSR